MASFLIVILVAVVSFLFGVLFSAALLQGKVSDLESQIWALERKNENLKIQLEFLREIKRAQKTTRD